MLMTLRRIAHRLSRAARREGGFTMILVLGVMLVVSLMLGAAFMATTGEIQLTGAATSQKKAYYAAQAGISDYLFHLTQDGGYLSYCTEPPIKNAALNQLYKTGTTEMTAAELVTNEHSVQVPEDPEERYSIQLLPAASAPSTDKKCDSSKLAETMIEKSGTLLAGTFRIQATGFAGQCARQAMITASATCQKRTIVATFKNEGFPSFVYYTKYETLDPVVYNGTSRQSQEAECYKFYAERPTWCTPIYFATGDHINGPLHTEDHGAICGSPIFGREKEPNDKIEFGQEGKKGETNSTLGYSNEQNGSCGDSPTFDGTYVPPKKVKSLEPPPSDNELQSLAESGYSFEGKTQVIFEGNEITVVNSALEGGQKKMPYPSNGVLYVANDASGEACSEEYTPYGSSYGYPACGNVYVRGNYSKSLTIGAANDIIIDGAVKTTGSTGTPTGAEELGLIANKFVRIYHPVAEVEGEPPEECKRIKHEETVWNERRRRWETVVWYTEECGKSTNCPSGTKYNESTKKCDYENSSSGCRAADITGEGTSQNPNPIPGTEGSMRGVEIQAAVLALNHSWIVDNYQCGQSGIEGSLKVYGAIAQLFRGPVGLIGSSGYEKEYIYDERLRASEPPHFLNPVEAPWKIERETLAEAPK
jgi:Tfp pilus assembly protein PilX